MSNETNWCNQDEATPAKDIRESLLKTGWGSIRPGDSYVVTDFTVDLFTSCVPWSREMADPLQDIQYAMKACRRMGVEPVEIVLSESDSELAVTRDASKVRLNGILFDSAAKAISEYTGLRVKLFGSGKPVLIGEKGKIANIQLAMNV